MTPQEKERFFAQYWGQRFERTMFYASDLTLHSTNVFRVNGLTISGIDIPPSINIGRVTDALLLRDLKDISDEDAIEVVSIYHKIPRLKCEPNRGKEITLKHKFISLQADVYQYLQSKGYALPWMQYSVEQLIEMGWIKLTAVKSAINEI